MAMPATSINQPHAAHAAQPHASLPMYDLPEARAATDALWTAIRNACRRRGLSPPLALDRGDSFDLSALAALPSPPLTPAAPPTPPPEPLSGQASALFLSQTCGLPLTSVHRGALRVVAVPKYSAQGCGPAATYRSCVIVPAAASGTSRAMPAEGGIERPVAAVNSDGSCSGSLLLGAYLAQHDAETGALEPPDGCGGGCAAGPCLSPACMDGSVFTGAHRSSVAAVAAGAADVAAIDCVTFGLLELHAPTGTARRCNTMPTHRAVGRSFSRTASCAAETRGVRVVGLTPAAPALPLVTSARNSDAFVAALREALHEVYTRQGSCCLYRCSTAAARDLFAPLL